MKKRIRRELYILAEHSSLLALCAVLTAFGGILLWVHGNMASWVFHALQMPSFVPGFTVFFLLWLFLYGLCGAVLAILLLIHGMPGISAGNVVKSGAVYMLAYILLLTWYPLFFSVVHSNLAIPVLIAAAVLHTWICIQNVQRFALLIPACFFTILLEIYFLCVTIAFVLAN